MGLCHIRPCEACGEAETTTFAGNKEPFRPPTTTRPLLVASWTCELCPVELASSMTAPSKGSVMGVDERYGFP